MESFGEGESDRVLVQKEVQMPQMTGRQGENLRVGSLSAIAGREMGPQPRASLRQLA